MQSGHKAWTRGNQATQRESSRPPGDSPPSPPLTQKQDPTLKNLPTPRLAHLLREGEPSFCRTHVKRNSWRHTQARTSVVHTATCVAWSDRHEAAPAVTAFLTLLCSVPKTSPAGVLQIAKFIELDANQNGSESGVLENSYNSAKSLSLSIPGTFSAGVEGGCDKIFMS